MESRQSRKITMEHDKPSRPVERGRLVEQSRQSRPMEHGRRCIPVPVPTSKDKLE